MKSKFRRFFPAASGMFVAGAVMLLSIGMILSRARAYHAAEEEYATLQQSHSAITWEPVPDANGNTGSSAGAVSSDPSSSPGDHRSEDLLCINPDYCAWLSMEDPAISYPVVRDAGDEYYLTHSFLGTENPAGCLFIDPCPAADFTSLNTFIHGHNMRDGSMFGQLQLLTSDKIWEKDPTFTLDVCGREMTYRIFAIAVVPEDSALYRCPAEETYDAYLEELRQSSLRFQSDAEELILRHCPLVTLSTCCGSAGTDQRLLVVGIRLS